MIHVLAIITAKPGLRSNLLALFNANVPNVRAEDGCIEYGAVIDYEGTQPEFGPDTFVVVEKWASIGALKAHAASLHMASYAAVAKEMIAERAVHVMKGA